MKKNLFLITGTVACIAGITGIVFLLFGKQDIYMISVAITAILAGVFLALDPDNKHQARKITPIVVASTIAIVIMLIVSMSSCTTTGYGCHGRSKCMTRVQ